MPIIRIKKEQVEKARRAHKKALGEDAEYRKFDESQERDFQEAIKQAEKEKKEEVK